MKRIQWLVVIDVPDERVPGHGRYDHMHAWFGDEDEAGHFLRLLSDRFPSRGHELYDPPATCPRCGAYVERPG